MKITKASSLATFETTFPTLPRPTTKPLGIGKKLINLAKTATEAFFNSLVFYSEPKIWKKIDAEGNIFWKTYDPVTGMTAQFDTEQEVRIWLEERYNA